MSKYGIRMTKQFRKDLKLAEKSGRDVDLLMNIVEVLADGGTLPKKYCDHKLTGNWKNHRECHIEPDWLMIYKQEDDVLVLTLVRTGSHSDLL